MSGPHVTRKWAAAALVAMTLAGYQAAQAAPPTLTGTGAVAAQARGGSPEKVGPVAVQGLSQVAARRTTALAVLPTLAVKGRASRTGYSRAQFGQAWSDDVSVDGGHNGCDTRNDVLRRDISGARIKPGTRGCVVLSGTLRDPYTGKNQSFQRGSGTSALVQIDHMVALSNAWQTGAQRLSAQRRRDLANDPLNLMAVNGSLNQAKGAGDAATWLPPRKAYRCAYVVRQVAVKQKYNLWVTRAERDAIARILRTCPGQTLPTRAMTAVPRLGVTSAPAVPSSPVRKPPSGSAYYSSCSAARAAGAAPLHRGDPGYRSGLDRDRDGVACE